MFGDYDKNDRRSISAEYECNTDTHLNILVIGLDAAKGCVFDGHAVHVRIQWGREIPDTPSPPLKSQVAI